MISHHFPLPDKKFANCLLEQIFTGTPAVLPQEDDKTVILYGAGNLGKMACEFLDYVGVKILFAYDRAAKEGDKLDDSIPVYPPEEAGEYKNHLILVTTISVPYTEIETYLSSLGWNRILPFYDYAIQYADIHPLNNGWFSGSLSSEDREKIREVLSVFSDGQSYAAYLQFLAWRVLREDWMFERTQVRMGNRFFIEPVRKVLTENETFFDVGAHEGEVFIRFLQETRGKFQSAYLFEPDKNNSIVLNKQLKKLHYDVQEKMTIIRKAVGIKTGVEGFGHSFGYTSRLWEKSSEEIEVILIDDLQIPFSFMKMHIEGGELSALEGGSLSLEKYRPMIAITVYHNRDGLWKIVLFLRDLLKRYLFLLRMHSWCGTGMVIYGIPVERMKVGCMDV